MSDRHQDLCKICGQPNPPGKRSLCSDACRRVARNQAVARYQSSKYYESPAFYPNMPPERRARYKACKQAYARSEKGQQTQARYSAKRREDTARRRATLPAYSSRGCVICGKSFTPRVVHQKTCGDQICQDSLHRQLSAAYARSRYVPTGRPRGRPRKEGVPRRRSPLSAQSPRGCVICCKVFAPKAIHQKTCGDQICQDSLRRRYARSRYVPTGRPRGRPKKECP
jgi:predicted nucleic acid-binding Zn ribbon protein